MVRDSAQVSKDHGNLADGGLDTEEFSADFWPGISNGMADWQVQGYKKNASGMHLAVCFTA